MSYDVWIEADLGGPEPLCVGDWNCTSNVAPMWRLAGANLAEMNGMPVSQARGILWTALEAMRADPAVYEALNPPNGWGNYDGCLKFLTDIWDACGRYPQHTTLRVSR